MSNLAVILDLHSRRVIGQAVSNRMKRDLAIRAVKMAIAFRALPKGCIQHTDRGSQYCSHDYRQILRQHGFKVSKSGKGNCYDNAAIETFFKTIKAELIWRDTWDTRRQAEMAIFDYINGFYNPRRRHSALRWKSPVAFERKVAQPSTWGGTKAGQVQFATLDDARRKLTLCRYDYNNVRPHSSFGNQTPAEARRAFEQLQGATQDTRARNDTTEYETQTRKLSL